MTRPNNSRAAVDQLLDTGPVAYYRAFAAIAGGATAGLFLSQLYYWHDRGRDPSGWIYKTQAEWEEETGLTRREQETARRKLRERGLVEEKLARMPARLHYRLKVDRLTALLAERRGEGVGAATASEAEDGAEQPSNASDAKASRAGVEPAPEGQTEPASSTGGSDLGGSDPRGVCTETPDKSAPKGQAGSAERAEQVPRKPPDKVARSRQTRLAETAEHAETTAETVRDDDKDQQAKTEAAAASPMTVTCSLHDAPMRLRVRGGDAWYSHRLPNGLWCRGGPGDQPEDAKADPQGLERRRMYAAQFADAGFAASGSEGGNGRGGPERPP